MDDLISRSETIKTLRHYAGQKHCGGEIELANGILKAMDFIGHTENMPTAYNVDKVVEENKQIKQAIYKASESIQEIVDYPHEFMSCADFFPKLREIQDELVGSIEDRQVE